MLQGPVGCLWNMQPCMRVDVWFGGSSRREISWRIWPALGVSALWGYPWHPGPSQWPQREIWSFLPQSPGGITNTQMANYSKNCLLLYHFLRLWGSSDILKLWYWIMTGTLFKHLLPWWQLLQPHWAPENNPPPPNIYLRHFYFRWILKSINKRLLINSGAKLCTFYETVYIIRNIR